MTDILYIVMIVVLGTVLLIPFFFLLGLLRDQRHKPNSDYAYDLSRTYGRALGAKRQDVPESVNRHWLLASVAGSLVIAALVYAVIKLG